MAEAGEERTPEYWSERLAAMESLGDPALYVTMAELADLKQACNEVADARERAGLPSWRPTFGEPIVSMLGLPVVIDPERAAAQTAAFGRSENA